jgi:hypothetical protein
VPITIDPVLASRIKIAWRALSTAQQQEIMPKLRRAHAHLEALALGGTPRAHEQVEHVLVLGLAVLSDDAEGLLRSVRPQGQLDGSGAIWGTGKYELLDPGWLEAFAEWLEHLVLGRHQFVEKAFEGEMGDVVTLGFAGDWGTGDWRGKSNPAPSTRIKQRLRDLAPDLTVHLGDVYYAGTGSEEKHLLTSLWPSGLFASAALNSNHEMYSGARPYFKAIAKAPFASQGGCSYFSFENEHWIVVGLDSAYFAAEADLYNDGALFDPRQLKRVQVDFLKGQVGKGKRLILLTHHNGLQLDGASTALLFDHVTAALNDAVGPVYWYWGHMHSGVVYRPRVVGGITARCRCCGHGGLPGGPAPDLEGHEATVEWYEHRSADDVDIPNRILNGFALIRLDGSTIAETFYDENGGVAWSA